MPIPRNDLTALLTDIDREINEIASRLLGTIDEKDLREAIDQLTKLQQAREDVERMLRVE